MRLGVIQADGSIKLDDKNIKFREQMTGRYQRYRQSPRQRTWLGGLGFTSIVSSFISAAKTENDDLIIRFNNGSVYKYFGYAKHLEPMLRANSKGQYFNRSVRPTKRYVKLDNMPFPDNMEPAPLKMDDDAMFSAMDLDYIKKLAQNLEGANIYANDVVVKGIAYTQYRINDLVVLRPKLEN